MPGISSWPLLVFLRKGKDTKYVCRMDLKANAGGICEIFACKASHRVTVLNAVDENVRPKRCLTCPRSKLV